MWVNIVEAKKRLSQLMRAVQAGQDVIIANRGKPVARLVPVAPETVDVEVLGSAGTILEWLKKHPLPRHAVRSESEIDAAIAQECASWD